MKRTDKSLLEQMRITDLELEERKQLFSIGEDTGELLGKFRPAVEREADTIVTRFYELQTAVPEIALLIGDSDTLSRLHGAQLMYVRDLFSGNYDLEYVNNRLRIGLVHHRIGVEPKLYLSAILTLKSLLLEFVRRSSAGEEEYRTAAVALENLLTFDVSLVFDTYIRSLVSEIELSKERTERYASALEDKVKERTAELERMSYTDPLTGLLNTRHLNKMLLQAVRKAQRHQEPVTIAYFDINDFKPINDSQGHQRGDEILCLVASTIREVSRVDDQCFRCGGDEFCVILSGCSAEQAEAIYEPRLLLELQKLASGLSISIGYAQTGPESYAAPEVLIRQADERMYASKHAHKAIRRQQDARPGRPATASQRALGRDS